MDSSFTHVRRGSIYWYTGGGMINGYVERCADNIMRRIVLSTGTHKLGLGNSPGTLQALKISQLGLSPRLSGNCYFPGEGAPFSQSSLLSMKLSFRSKLVYYTAFVFIHIDYFKIIVDYLKNRNRIFAHKY